MSSLEERKRLLFEDPDISKVEPHRVFCNRCHKWLKLDEVKLYAASVWRCHKNTKSHNSRPSNSSATPSHISEEDQQCSSSNDRSVVGSISASPSLRLKRSGLKKTSFNRRISMGDPSRLRSSDTGSVSSASSTTRAMSRLKNAVRVASGVGFSNTKKESSLKSEAPTNSLSFDLKNGQTSTPDLQPNSLKPPPMSLDGSALNNDAQATRLPMASPEAMSPHRKASYRALLAEPYIGKLEPYRAFCTQCNLWVHLSQRTPYSYGVWKGHVRKSDKHNHLQPSNPHDEYNTGSDQSQDEGIKATPRVASKHDGRFAEDGIVVAHKQQPTKKIKSEMVTVTVTATSEDVAVNASPHPQNQNEPVDVADNFSTKGTKANAVARTTISEERPVDDIIADENVFSKLTPQKQASLLSLQRRRQTIVSDPDAAIVEPRKVKCGICDRWIKGSTTQAYSLHHWLKHRKKCLRNKKELMAEPQSEVDARRELLENDSDIDILEYHRAFCNRCNKWIKLGNRSKYSTNHWSQHKQNCPAVTGDKSRDASRSPVIEETRLPNLSVSLTANMRRFALQFDPNISELWSDKVTCRRCSEPVSLSPSIPFLPEPWITHKEACYKLNATDNVWKEYELKNRKEILEQDSKRFEVEPSHIQCKRCKISIDFDVNMPYSLVGWELHSRGCFLNQASTLHSEPRENQMEMEVDIKTPSPTDVLQTDNSMKTTTAPDNAVLTQKIPDDDANTRLEFLLRQPDILKVRAHSVLCGRCLVWISHVEIICSREKWFKHKDSCPGIILAPVRDYHSNASRSDRYLGRDRIGVGIRSARGIPKVKVKAPNAIRAPSPMTLPPLPPRARWPGEDERKHLFMEDPDVLRIEPHRLLCKNCNCWIKLHPIIRYSQSIWPRHKTVCRPDQTVTPGDVRMKAKSEKEDIRRQMLEDDPYVTEIGPHRVTCKACSTNIRLDTTYKYEGSHWRAHRARCAQIPFVDRSTKRRKSDTRRPSLHESPTVREQIDSSSDSDDSDASSAPRPRPTTFFTMPLELNPLKMFKPSLDEAYQPVVETFSPTREDKIFQHLQDLAVDLDNSDRLNMVIESSGFGPNERRFGQEKLNDIQTAGEATCGSDYCIDKSREMSDTESWIPRKRTQDEFNAVLEQWPRPPSPNSKGKRRICKLPKVSMQVLE